MTVDPWRYRCVECGSTRLEQRVTAGKDTFNGSGADKRYYCNNCSVARDSRRDMKTGKVIA